MDCNSSGEPCQPCQCHCVRRGYGADIRNSPSISPFLLPLQRRLLANSYPPHLHQRTLYCRPVRPSFVKGARWLELFKSYSACSVPPHRPCRECRGMQWIDGMGNPPSHGFRSQHRPDSSLLTALSLPSVELVSSLCRTTALRIHIEIQCADP